MHSNGLAGKMATYVLDSKADATKKSTLIIINVLNPSVFQRDFRIGQLTLYMLQFT